MPDNDLETGPAQTPPATDAGPIVAEPDAPNPLIAAAMQRMSAPAPVTLSNPADVDLGSGRGLLYEWEVVVAGIYTRIDALEQAGPGGGGAFYFHNQVVPSSSWTIPHHLGTAPDVLVLDVSGQQLFAEIHYPDTDTAVVVHGTPYAGSAYLRG